MQNLAETQAEVIQQAPFVIVVDAAAVAGVAALAAAGAVGIVAGVVAVVAAAALQGSDSEFCVGACGPGTGRS